MKISPVLELVANTASSDKSLSQLTTAVEIATDKSISFVKLNFLFFIFKFLNFIFQC